MKINRKTPENSPAVRNTAVSVADESLFQRLLLLERRRCERSGERFALMLIDVEWLRRTFDVPALDEVAGTVATAMRETDITGWCPHPQTIGVVLTTLNGADRTTFESAVIERARRALSEHLDSVQLEQVRISCHVFPEDEPGSASGGNPGRGFFTNPEKRKLRSAYPAAVKRAVDIAGSLAALAVLWPLFATIALLVKLTSKGPVFFRQKRLGQFGQEFTFLKFRTMVANNDPAIHKEYIRNLIGNKVPEPGATFKIQNDPRVTPLGRFLRKSSLDELPQFINVLWGEMSLVGPRPPIPYEVENYALWHKRRVLEAKPGITGVWQVDGRSRTTFDEMVRMDLRYIRNQSLWLDLKILFRTPVAMFWGNGAC